MDDELKPHDALDSAGERRQELKTAVSLVETMAAAPAAAPEWRNDLLGALDHLRVAFDCHIDEVERDDGLLIEVAAAEPRLIRQVDQVRDEHPLLRAQIAGVIDDVHEGVEPDRVRTQVLDVLVAVARHRQKGADLVYEAYSVDIGGG